MASPSPSVDVGPIPGGESGRSHRSGAQNAAWNASEDLRRAARRQAGFLREVVRPTSHGRPDLRSRTVSALAALWPAVGRRRRRWSRAGSPVLVGLVAAVLAVA